MRLLPGPAILTAFTVVFLACGMERCLGALNGARGMGDLQATVNAMSLDDRSLLAPEDHSESGQTGRLVLQSSSGVEPGATPLPAVSFEALHDTVDLTPPDTHGAVGPNHVMTTLNTNVRIQTRTGQHVVAFALQSFWARLDNPIPFDPKVVYDPFADRWIFTAVANRFSTNSSLLIGVSQTGNPAGEWHLHRLSGIGGEWNWMDYPSLGFNKKWIVVQVIAKRFGGKEFAESHIYAFNRSALYAGGPAAFTRFITEEYDAVQSPAVTLDPDAENLYLVAAPTRELHDNASLGLLSISGEIGSEILSEVRTFTGIPPWTSKPPGEGNFAPQLGLAQKLHLQASSMMNVVFRDGSIWCTHHIFLPNGAPERSAVQWFQFTTNLIVQHGVIDDPTGQLFYAYPSIAVNRQNDVLIGFSRFSAEDYAGGYYAFRAASDPPGKMRPEALLKAGEGPYLKTRGTGQNRWGDYSSTVVDPVNDRCFWTIQEYAALPFGNPEQDGSGRWGTWWGKIEVPHLLRITSLERTDAVVRFRFSTVAGERYRVEKSDLIQDDSWSAVVDVTGTGEMIQVTDPTAANNLAQFYRIRWMP
jgi:hypothetical protein